MRDRRNVKQTECDPHLAKDDDQEGRDEHANEAGCDVSHDDGRSCVNDCVAEQQRAQQQVAALANCMRQA